MSWISIQRIFKMFFHFRSLVQLVCLHLKWKRKDWRRGLKWKKKIQCPLDGNRRQFPYSYYSRKLSNGDMCDRKRLVYLKHANKVFFFVLSFSVLRNARVHWGMMDSNWRHNRKNMTLVSSILPTWTLWMNWELEWASMKQLTNSYNRKGEWIHKASFIKNSGHCEKKII